MKVAYVDTSGLVAIALGQAGGPALARRARAFDLLVSSGLLEAEFRSTCAREDMADPDRHLEGIAFVMPDRPLHREIRAVLDAGYVRGADCWHLATAVHYADDRSALTFLTLDRRQRDVAAVLGFNV